MHTFHFLSIQCIQKIPSEISHDAIVIECSIFLLLSSFWPEHSTLVQVFNKIGLIYAFLSITPLIFDSQTFDWLINTSRGFR